MAAAPPAAKQAVVIIHGIGEQVPMDTLRGFAETVWDKDEPFCNPESKKDPKPLSWSKPDEISGDFELRRITTNANKKGVRTDFFEFYWAHLMKDTKLSAVWARARVLLLRPPWRVPRRLIWAWLFLWIAIVSFVIGAAFKASPVRTQAIL